MNSGDPQERTAALGETLRSIAAQTGIPVRELGQRNRLTRSDELVYGQRIRLPAAAGGGALVYRVAPGDTPALIAAQFGVSPYSLRRANRLTCPGCVFVRQLVRVPWPSPAASLPQPFADIDLTPAQPSPGDVVVVRVTTTVPVRNLSGTFGGRPLRFVPRAPGANTYVALTGIGVLDDPGHTEVDVRAITPGGLSADVDGRASVLPYSYGAENVTITKTLINLLDPKLNQTELDQFAELYGQWSAGQMWQGPLRLPIDGRRVTSNFGARRSYNGGLLRTYHSGIDISAPVNTPVKAMAAGRVVAARAFPVRGNVVIIDHGRGVMTAYCHLSKWIAQPGDFVNAGDVIAYSGNTGRTEGPHLHFELAVNGVVVDPRDWLRQALP